MLAVRVEVECPRGPWDGCDGGVEDGSGRQQAVTDLQVLMVELEQRFAEAVDELLGVAGGGEVPEEFGTDERREPP